MGVGFPPPDEHIIGYMGARSTDGVQLVDRHRAVVFDLVRPGAEAERLAESIGGQSAELVAAAGIVCGTETGSPANGDLTAEQAAGDGIDGRAELNRVDGHLLEASWKAKNCCPVRLLTQTVVRVARSVAGE